MGAFVGAVTSPFLRRRKGRIGADKWIEKTAPTYAGAEIQFAAGNHIALVCCPNASTTYQWNDTQGDGAWTSVALLVNQRIGNVEGPKKDGRMRPFFEDMDFETWNEQQSFNTGGILSGTGGALYFISAEGRFAKSAVIVPGRPQEDIAWTNDGKYFMSAGAAGAGLVTCRGGLNPAAPESFTYASAVANGCASIHPLDDPANPYPNFIVGDNSDAAVRPFHRITRKDAVWSSVDIDSGMISGFIPQKWIQHRDLVIGIGSKPAIARSTDLAKSFTSVASGGGTQVNDIWRYGNRLFLACQDHPRLRISKDYGKTWINNPTALPSGTAIPSATAEQWNTRYLFCHDGAVNRLYIHKPYTDI